MTDFSKEFNSESPFDNNIPELLSHKDEMSFKNIYPFLNNQNESSEFFRMYDINDSYTLNGLKDSSIEYEKISNPFKIQENSNEMTNNKNKLPKKCLFIVESETNESKKKNYLKKKDHIVKKEKIIQKIYMINIGLIIF